jgi:hypothetical protein
MPIINKMASISWSISKHEQLHLFSPMRVHFITFVSYMNTLIKASIISDSTSEVCHLKYDVWSMSLKYDVRSVKYDVRSVKSDDIYGLTPIYVMIYWIYLGYVYGV